MRIKSLIHSVVACGAGTGSLLSSSAYAQADAPVVEVAVDEKLELGYVRAKSEVKVGSIEELAKQAGFAKYLPKESEAYFSIIGMNDMLKKLRGMEIVQLFEEQLKKQDPESESLDDMLATKKAQKFSLVAGEEVFIALGGKSSDFLSNLITGVNEMNKLQYDVAARLLLSHFDPELIDTEDMTGGLPFTLENPEEFLELLKSLEVAPVYAGFKVSDKDQREEFVADIMNMMRDTMNKNEVTFMQPVDSAAGDGFFGFNISGEGFVKKIETEDLDGIDELEKMIGAKELEKFKTELSKKNITVMVGSVDDYVVFYAGKDSESLKLANSVSDSLLANEEMDFAKNHSDKELAVLGYYSKDIVKAAKSVNGGLSLYTNAFSNVLKETEVFGDTSKLIALFKEFQNKENSFYAKSSEESMGIVGSFDEGFKLDFYVGEDYPGADLDSNRKLAHMANQPSAAVYGSWITDVNYSKAINDYFVAMWKVAYEGTSMISKQEFPDESFLNFQQSFQLFDSTFADDALRLWNAIDVDLRQGLSAEQAFVLDLEGMLPRVPNVPSVVLENVEIPRFTVAHSVVDREKLSASWDKINAAAKDIANGVGKITGSNIPLPQPEKVKRYGLDTWSYQLGVTTKEANLAVGLDDELWFLTSGPTALEQLVARAKDEGGQQAEPGAELVVRLDVVRTAMRKGMKFLEEHGEQFGEEGYQKFLGYKDDVEKFIKASEQLELIDIYTRKENGGVRSTIHFKTR